MYQIIDYQIKSTPYFRRVLTTNKQNGQLQKLKEEYERIKDFDVRPIQSKMRRMRLKRLFNEIEDIKNTDSKKRRLGAKEKPQNKTEKDERFENLIRAKNLGQYYSQRNSLGTPVNDTGRRGLTYKEKKLKEVHLKACMSKRIIYGNQISSWNMQKMLMGEFRKEIQIKVQNNGDIDKIDNNKQGISYENTTNINLENSIPKSIKNFSFSNECKKTKIDYNSDSKTSVLTLNANSHVNESNLDPTLFESCDEIDNNQLQSIVSCYPTESRAKMNWFKLASLINNRFDMNRDKCENVLEHQLRSTSNDTDLLQNYVIPIKNEELNLSENEDECNNESFVSAEYLFEVTTKISDSKLLSKPSPPLATLIEQGLGLKSVTQPPKALIDEPHLKDVVKENAHELKFQKIRQIFEHRNK